MGITIKRFGNCNEYEVCFICGCGYERLWFQTTATVNKITCKFCGTVFDGNKKAVAN